MSDNAVTEFDDYLKTHNKKRAKLHKWALKSIDGIYFLYGVVIGHPSFVNGKIVMTSQLLNINFETMEAETLNTIYTLKE
jgi:hypothetical protein